MVQRGSKFIYGHQQSNLGAHHFNPRDKNAVLIIRLVFSNFNLEIQIQICVPKCLQCVECFETRLRISVEFTMGNSQWHSFG